MPGPDAGPGAPLRIVAIDDNASDLLLLAEVIAPLPAVLTTFTDGEEAWQWLHGDAAPDVQLVLLNLHMPGEGGIAWLRRLRQDPALGTLVVVMRSGSSQAESVLTAYRSQVNAFLPKPASLGALDAQMTALVGFWSSCLFGTPGE